MLWEVLEIGEVFRRDTTYQTPITTYYINILYLILHNTNSVFHQMIMFTERKKNIY